MDSADRNKTEGGNAEGESFLPGNGAGFAPRPESDATRFVLVVLSFVVFATLLKAPSLQWPRQEADEVIYLQLARQIVERGEYTLQGTPILPELPSGMYDRPMFHHPPLFPLLLTPFVAAGIPDSGVWVSWLGHILCILAVALLARHILSARGGTFTPFDARFWIPLLGVSLDPILMFVSRRVWMDNVLAGFFAMAICLAVIAVGKYRRALLVASGVCLGFAGLTKITGLLAGPLIVLWLLCDRRQAFARRVAGCLCVAIPAIVLVVPWFIAFHNACGAWLPTWAKADPMLIETNPFVREFVNRPASYYTVNLLLLTPLVLLNCVCFVYARRVRDDAYARFGFVWLLVGLVAITAVSASGVGYLMRHVCLCVPAIYVMSAACLAHLGGRTRPVAMLSVLLIAYSALSASVYLWSPQPDEIAPFVRMMGWIP